MSTVSSRKPGFRKNRLSSAMGPCTGCSVWRIARAGSGRQTPGPRAWMHAPAACARPCRAVFRALSGSGGHPGALHPSRGHVKRYTLGKRISVTQLDMEGSDMLKNKKAVVTGSTSGIGLAIARQLARNGADVVINGFGDAAEIERTRAAIESEYGVRAHYLNADLSKGEETRQFIEEAVKVLGGIDILVNNAGIQHTALIEDFPT